MAPDDKFNYGDDFPDDLRVYFNSCQQLGSAFDMRASPMVMLSQIEAVATFKPPERKKGGVRMPEAAIKAAALKNMIPAAAGVAEEQGEQAARLDAQLACRKLILPKSAKEQASGRDYLLKRLAAHREAPEAFILPMQPKEPSKEYFARLGAASQNTSSASLVLPKQPRERDDTFAARMQCASVTPSPLVFPLGNSESASDFEQRLKAQTAAFVPVMPRSEGETDHAFTARCEAQSGCNVVIHPFDGQREGELACMERLALQKRLVSEYVPPGDERAVSAAEEKGAGVPYEVPYEAQAAPATAAPLTETASDGAASKHPSTLAAIKEDPPAGLSPAEKARFELSQLVSGAYDREQLGAAKYVDALEAALESACNIGVVGSLIDDASAKLANAEVEAAVAGPMRIDMNAIGFKALKDLMVERGVPAASVKSVSNKFLLRELAGKHPECDLEFA